MFKNLKWVAIVIAIVVVGLSFYKGVPAVIGYIEGKAREEVKARQVEDSLKVQVEMDELTIDFNRDLSKEVATSTEYFKSVDSQLDEIIATRQANAVELPSSEITGLQSVVPKSVANKPEPLKPKVDDVSELTLAWQSFCKIRPSYKDCIEGTHP